MAKEKFVRTKPHVNIGTIGHKLTVLQKKKQEESQSTQHTLNMKQKIDTMHTLTAQDMLTTLKT